jgi:hypothetical protein
MVCNVVWVCAFVDTFADADSQLLRTDFVNPVKKADAAASLDFAHVLQTLASLQGRRFVDMLAVGNLQRHTALGLFHSVATILPRAAPYPRALHPLGECRPLPSRSVLLAACAGV